MGNGFLTRKNQLYKKHVPIFAPFNGFQTCYPTLKKAVVKTISLSKTHQKEQNFLHFLSFLILQLFCAKKYLSNLKY